MSGKKYDGGKSPVFQGCLLYFPRALEAVAFVSEFGAKKYEAKFRDQNWREVDDADRYQNAKARHLLAAARGEVYAGDSHLLHAAHEAWNALALLERLLTDGVPVLEQEQEVPNDLLPTEAPLMPGQRWRVGDTVVARETTGTCLVKGDEYIVVHAFKNEMGWYLEVKNCDGHRDGGGWDQSRFDDPIPF